MASVDQLLRCLAPLKVVIVTESAGPEFEPLRKAISQAFHGAQPSVDNAESYYPWGEDLGVAVLVASSPVEAQNQFQNALQAALHVLVIAVIFDRPSDPFSAVLSEIEQAAADAEGNRQCKVALLPILIRERVWSGDSQTLEYAQLGEYAARSGYASAHALAAAWRLVGPFNERLRMFISHAKLDGWPLANSLRHQLADFHGLQHFYDAADIPPGSNWKRALRDGVRSSVLVSLRTNVYEERFWCVQEMDWAKDFGCPVIMVEARTTLVRTREVLPVAGSPSVYVPDGNLLRVVQSSLREALRIRLFNCQVDSLVAEGTLRAEKTVRVPRSSLATLGTRCDQCSSAAKSATHVLIPEDFREAHRRVAAMLVRAFFPGAWLGTPQQLINQTITAISS